MVYINEHQKAWRREISQQEWDQIFGKKEENMSTCIRGGNTYKRHAYKNKKCKHCGNPQPERKAKA